MLKAQNISHAFASKETLFEDISFELNFGESMSIMGKSGSGKSTLLHIISSFCNPLNGKVFLENQDLYSLSDDEIIKLRREELSIIFQSHYLIRGMDARENLELASLASSQTIDYDLLKALNIEKVLDSSAHSLSGGEQQRLSIARALIKGPKFIFADEPTGNLDKAMSIEVIGTLLDYAKNRDAILVLITHEQEYGDMCKHRFFLENKSLKRA